MHSRTKRWVARLVIAVLSHGAICVFADDSSDVKKELQELREQNRLLQIQLQQQQLMIDQLNKRFSGLEKTNEQHGQNMAALEAQREGTTPPPDQTKSFSLGNVAITGEGAVGFFDTEKNGRYPNAAFRADEARLFLDAPLSEKIYFFSEIDLATAEAHDNGLYLAELYLQFENLGEHWGMDDLINARLGQFYIPYGEEYQYRFASDDPLISHSLSDVWGYNPGVELYGSWRKFGYAVAVQNGGISTLNDGTADKSISGRISYDPLSWLHLSASAMRTGNVSVSGDGVSALWFGGGLFQSIGPADTSLFNVNLAEFDASAKWKSGYVKGALGYADYNDNGATAMATGASGGLYAAPTIVNTDDHRDIYYYYLETVQHLSSKFYAASRFSGIRSRNGYAIEGDTPTFGLPTSDLWRLSLGLGYQVNRHLTLKAEYLIEHGQLSTGGSRNHENMFATEAAFKF